MKTISSPSQTSRTPLAYGASELARRLEVSPRHVRRLNASARLPRPIFLGRSVRWFAAEIEEWLAAGGPDRKTWEAMKRPGRVGRR